MLYTAITEIHSLRFLGHVKKVKKKTIELMFKFTQKQGSWLIIECLRNITIPLVSRPMLQFLQTVQKSYKCIFQQILIVLKSNWHCTRHWSFKKMDKLLALEELKLHWVEIENNWENVTNNVNYAAYHTRVGPSSTSVSEKRRAHQFEMPEWQELNTSPLWRGLPQGPTTCPSPSSISP